jgi:hypothetical protein
VGCAFEWSEFSKLFRFVYVVILIGGDELAGGDGLIQLRERVGGVE